MMLLFFVLAAAYPYFSNEDLKKQNSRAVFLYLDNSFSMQAKRGEVSLFDIAKKDIENTYRDFKDAYKIYLLTNSAYSLIESEHDLTLELSKANYTHDSFSGLKAKTFVSDIAQREGILDYYTLIFSDFKEKKPQTDSLFSDMSVVEFTYWPENDYNISIDSIWFDNVTVSSGKFMLKYMLRNFGDETNTEVEFNEQVSFDNKVQQIVTRAVRVNRDTVFGIELSVPDDMKASGFVSIEDNSLEFDNEMFFSVDFNMKSKVLFVGQETSKTLNLILNDPFMELHNASHSNLSLVNLEDFDFVVYTINRTLPEAELKKVMNYIKSDNNILLLPGSDISYFDFNKFLNQIGLGNVSGMNKAEEFLTGINYDNDFFDDIFDSKVENFDYPQIENSFHLRVGKSHKLLSFDSGKPFLLQRENKNSSIFIFSAPIFDGDKAFINYDMSIPVLYKIVSSGLSGKLYNKVGDRNVQISGFADDLSLKLNNEFVDLYKASSEKALIPKIDRSGSFDIYSNDKVVKTVSYNYSRFENRNFNINRQQSSVSAKYDSLKKQGNVLYLWRWCLTFTFAFLLLEISLILFLKEKR